MTYFSGHMHFKCLIKNNFQGKDHWSRYRDIKNAERSWPVQPGECNISYLWKAVCSCTPYIYRHCLIALIQIYWMHLYMTGMYRVYAYQSVLIICNCGRHARVMHGYNCTCNMSYCIWKSQEAYDNVWLLACILMWIIHVNNFIQDNYSCIYKLDKLFTVKQNIHVP